VTLAVGDGANDVPMIQQAQVGVGISGREGRQAVNASDFAIAQFRYLQRLLLVHGRWDYRRMCKFVLYSFWKNAVLTLLLFYYTFISGYSGTSMFTSLVWTSFNVILGFPIIATGIFDRDVSAREALQNPSLYETGRLGLDLNLAKMTEMLLSALVHSLILFWVMMLAFSPMQCTTIGDYYSFGTVIYTWLIIAMNYRVIFITTTMNWLFAAAVVSSFLMYALFMIVYCTWDWLEPFMYMVIFQVCKEPLFWVGAFSIPALAMALDIFKAYFVLEFLPDRRDLALERAKAAKVVSGQTPRRPQLLEGLRGTGSSLTSGRTTGTGSFSSFHFDYPEAEEPRHQLFNTERHAYAGDTSLMDRLRHTATGSPVGLRRTANGSPRVEVAASSSDGEGGRQGSKRRPRGSRFAQQGLPSYTFVLTWRGVVLAAVCTGTWLLVVGIAVLLASDMVGKITVQYDGPPKRAPLGSAKEELHYLNCSVPGVGQTASCVYSLTVAQDMEPPVYIVYTVDPFYQNYNSYMQSVIYDELLGRPMDESLRRAACSSRSTRLTPDGDHIYPCGLLATTVFNDTFELLGLPLTTQDSLESMKSDYTRFANPRNWSSWRDMSWLWERYPMVTTPELGVESRHFVSWMLPEFFSHVNNLYGAVGTPLRKGETLTLRINASFPVESLGARKQVLVMTKGLLGGRNYPFAVVLMANGGFCFFMAIVISAIHWLCPREPGRGRSLAGGRYLARAAGRPGESEEEEDDSYGSSTDTSGSGSSTSC